MATFANTLKAEISRIARREVRAETAALKKANAQHRAHIAALRRQIAALEKAFRKGARKSQAERISQQETEKQGQLRFRAAGLTSHRKRLGLSAVNFGRLIGVSGQTVYKWEQGGAKPRQAQLEAIASVRKMGRREVQAALSKVAPKGQGNRI